MGRNQYWAGRVYDLCVYYMTGTPEGSTESGLMEKPGIEPTTPGLQGIALIHYTMGASPMGESSKFPKSWSWETEVLKLAVYLKNFIYFKYKWSIILDKLKTNQRSNYNLPNDNSIILKTVTYVQVIADIVRPANRDWAWQTESCHTLSNRTSLQ